MENILPMAYGNYNVVPLAVMTLLVTMPMLIGTLMIGEEEDGSYYSSELGRMSFIGIPPYQLNLTNFEDFLLHIKQLLCSDAERR